MDAPWRTFGYHVFTDDVSKNKAILITVKHREAYISHLLTPIKKVNVEMLNTYLSFFNLCLFVIIYTLPHSIRLEL